MAFKEKIYGNETTDMNLSDVTMIDNMSSVLLVHDCDARAFHSSFAPNQEPFQLVRSFYREQRL